jgi:hypothetical protein
MGYIAGELAGTMLQTKHDRSARRRGFPAGHHRRKRRVATPSNDPGRRCENRATAGCDQRVKYRVASALRRPVDQRSGREGCGDTALTRREAFWGRQNDEATGEEHASRATTPEKGGRFHSAQYLAECGRLNSMSRYEMARERHSGKRETVRYSGPSSVSVLSVRRTSDTSIRPMVGSASRTTR